MNNPYRQIRFSFHIIITFVLSALLFACSNGSSGTAQISRLVLPPGVSDYTPESGTLIGNYTTIQIVFDSPVEASSISLSGDMASSATPSLNTEGTTLTLSPTTFWFPGRGRTLTVNINQTGDCHDGHHHHHGDGCDQHHDKDQDDYHHHKDRYKRHDDHDNHYHSYHKIRSYHHDEEDDHEHGEENDDDHTGCDQITIDLEYDVAVLFVNNRHPDTSDSNPGTIELPITTIQAALAKGDSLFDIYDVYVAQGNYIADPTIKMGSNARLRGGYNGDFTDRIIAPFGETSTYETVILYPLTTCPGPCVEPSIRIAAGAGEHTLLEGFTSIQDGPDGPAIDKSYTELMILDGGKATIRLNRFTTTTFSYHTAIEAVGGSPIIEQNTFTPIAFYGFSAIDIAGSGNPIVRNNRINGDAEDVVSFGIKTTAGTVYGNIVNIESVTSGGAANIFGTTLLYNNILSIHPAFPDAGGAGLMIDDSASAFNNTIHVFSDYPDAGEGILVQLGGSPTISNNIVIGNDICIAYRGVFAGTLDNNDLFNCQVFFVSSVPACPGDLDGDGDPNTCSVAEANAIPGVTDVFDQDPGLNVVDAYRFTAGSPLRVTEGGLDFSSIFNNDIFGNPRTLPWSMGAHENP